MPSTKSTGDINQDAIEIRVVTQEDRPQVLDLLHKYFFPDEPINAYTEPLGDIQQEEEDVIMANIQYGTCFIAIYRPTRKAVGICMAGPQPVDPADYLLEDAAKISGTKFGKYLKLLAQIERESEVCKNYNAQKIMYASATCVDAKMRGKHIGARLYNAVRDSAKESGYQLLRSDCSSYYSARIKEQLGWDCIHTVYYKDYLDENNEPIFVTHPPHVCCKSYVIRL